MSQDELNIIKKKATTILSKQGEFMDLIQSSDKAVHYMQQFEIIITSATQILSSVTKLEKG